jgi:hypothetical protein
LPNECPHLYLQNRPAIGKLLNAADFVAGAFWRQADQGTWATAGLEHVWINISLDYILEKPNQQNQNKGRNIYAAEIWYYSPDRSEQRFRQRGHDVPNRSHDIVIAVDDIKGDEPREDRHGDDHIDIEV